MRKFKFFIVVLSILLSVNFLTVDAAGKKFTDVPEKYEGADYIYRFTEQGVIRGYGDGTFGPYDSLTREQAAIIFARLLDLELPDSKEVSKYFKDIKPNNKNAAAIAAVGKAKIMTGDNGQFKPYSHLTREQMATILVRGLELKDNNRNVKMNLRNISKSHAKNVKTIANLGITNQLDNFRPAENVTRAQFLIMLGRAIDGKESIANLLREIYANEQLLSSYDMEANLYFSLDLPQLFDDEEELEFGMISQLFEDIQIDLKGSYQKDPMLMEAVVDVTMQIEPQVKTTLSIPLVISTDKVWMKMPQIPGVDLPEQFKDKYIEIDLNDFQEQAPIDLDTQIEFAQAVQNIFIYHFADDYYRVIEKGEYEVSEGIDAKKIIKFNLENEDLTSFVETLLTGFLPEFFDIVQQPEYANILGLTDEELKQVSDELNKISGNIDEIVSTVDNLLNINVFEEYIVINEDNIIVNDVLDFDVDFTIEDQVMGIVLKSNQTKKNINGNVTINIPSKDEIVSFEELLDETIE